MMKKYFKTLGLFSVLLFLISSILMVKDKAFPERIDIRDFKIGNNAAIEGVYGIEVSHHQGKIDWAKVEKWKNKKIQFV